MPSPEVFEVHLDVVHLLVGIPVGYDRLRATDCLRRIVNAIEQNRQSGLQCDIVESLFPFRCARPCSLGCDAEVEGFAFAGHCCQLVGQACFSVAPHRNSSQTPHQYAQRPEKPFMFHQEIATKSHGTAVEQAQDEVKVARMRCQCDDVFVFHRDGNHGFPSYYFEQEKAAKLARHLAELADDAHHFVHLRVEVRAQFLIVQFRAARFCVADSPYEFVVHQQDAGHHVVQVILFYLYLVV